MLNGVMDASNVPESEWAKTSSVMLFPLMPRPFGPTKRAPNCSCGEAPDGHNGVVGPGTVPAPGPSGTCRLGPSSESPCVMGEQTKSEQGWWSIRRSIVEHCGIITHGDLELLAEASDPRGLVAWRQGGILMLKGPGPFARRTPSGDYRGSTANGTIHACSPDPISMENGHRPAKLARSVVCPGGVAPRRDAGPRGQPPGQRVI